MNEQKEAKEPKKQGEPQGEATAPIHIIRRGAIAASIWRRQTATGHPFYDYSLSRSWKSVSTGRTGYSTNFSERNEKALVEVVQLASAWIATQGQENQPEDAQEALVA